MSNCKSCYNSIKNGDILGCPNCGAKFCPSCANKTKKICPNCYYDLEIMG